MDSQTSAMTATGSGGQDPNKGGHGDRGGRGGRGYGGVQKPYRHRNKCKFCGKRGHYIEHCHSRIAQDEVFRGLRELGRRAREEDEIFRERGGGRGGQRGGQRGGRGEGDFPGGHQNPAGGLSALLNDTHVQPTTTTTRTQAETLSAPASVQQTTTAGTGLLALQAPEQRASDPAAPTPLDPRLRDIFAILSRRDNPEGQNGQKRD